MKNRIIIVVFFISLFGIFNHIKSQVVLTLQPDANTGKDATIWYLSNQNLPVWGATNSSNYGNSPDFVAIEWKWIRFPGRKHSLIEFDLSSIPLGTVIDSAFLSLYHDTNSVEGSHINISGTNAGFVQRIIEPWNESTVTWNNAPNTTLQNQVLIPQSINPTQNYENIIVTALVQDMLDNPNSGFGFKIKLQIPNFYRKLVFASSDNADSLLHPKLVVYYSNCSAQTVDIGNDTLICNIDTLQLSVGNTGATSYLWSTGETTQTIFVSPIFTTEYFVTVVYNDCSVYDSILIEVNNIPVSDLIEDTTICSSDTLIMIVGDTNSSYYWSTDEYIDSIEISNSGIYYVTVSNGCGFIVDSVTVEVIAMPNVNLPDEINICLGDSVILNAGASNSDYFWSTGETSDNIVVYSSGLYEVYVSNECGLVEDSVNVTVITPPLVNLGNDTSICEGDTVFLNAQNQGFNFLWSNGETTQSIIVTPSLQTLFSILVENSGCSVTDSILITPLPSPIVFLGGDTIVCEKDNIFLDAGNSGATYLWSDGSTSQTITVMPDSSMTIYVLVSYSGCIDADTFDINIFSAPQIFLGNDTVLCEGNTLELDAANMGAEFLWSTGESSQQIVVSNSGLYVVTVTNQCEDIYGDSINVSIMQNQDVNLGNDTTIEFSQTFILDAGPGFLSYQWSNGETNQSIILDSSQLNIGASFFSVNVIDSNFCIGNDSIIIYLAEFQAISINSGWSIISTYINPVQANVDSVMNYLSSEIVIMKSGMGMIYWPMFSLNSIGDFVIGEGYQIKMNSSQTLFVYGNAVIPELTPITVPQNWSYLGYLRKTPAPIQSTLFPIENEIVMVKNGSGNIYWPLFSLNNIGNMIPGEGYQIKIDNSVVLIYPAN